MSEDDWPRSEGNLRDYPRYREGCHCFIDAGNNHHWCDVCMKYHHDRGKSITSKGRVIPKKK